MATTAWISLLRTGVYTSFRGRVESNLIRASLERRKAAWTPPPRQYARGYASLFLDRVRQADEGCDLDFLENGPATPEPEIH